MTVRQPHLLRVLVGGAAAVLLICGIYSVVRRAYAATLAGQFTLTASARSVTLAPGNAQFWLLRAEVLDQAGIDGEEALTRAIELNPLDAKVWLRLGLAAEARNDFERAERCLLESARVSRLFQPRSTLANFYFRRGSNADFWKWTRSALELSPGEPQSLFRLCWKMSQDPDEILRRAIPASPRVLRNYTEFLLAENRLDAARAVLEHLLADASPADLDLLWNLCDRFIDSRMVQPALDVWNAICKRKLSSCGVLQPEAGVSLTNGAFDAPGFGRGFDWRFNAVPGITAAIQSGVAPVYLSGKEPGNATTIWQWVPVAPGGRYLLHLEYQTSQVTPGSGIRWQVASPADGGFVVLGSTPDLSSSAWKQETIRFEAPAGATLIRVGLTYSRPDGAVRIEGSVVTRLMRLVRTA